MKELASKGEIRAKRKRCLVIDPNNQEKTVKLHRVPTTVPNKLLVQAFNDMCMLVHEDIDRVPGYEDTVRRYHEYKLKRLFRLSREMFEWLSFRFRVSTFYLSAVQGHQQIYAHKTCLTALALVYIEPHKCPCTP